MVGPDPPNASTSTRAIHSATLVRKIPAFRMAVLLIPRGVSSLHLPTPHHPDPTFFDTMAGAPHFLSLLAGIAMNSVCSGTNTYLRGSQPSRILLDVGRRRLCCQFVPLPTGAPCGPMRPRTHHWKLFFLIQSQANISCLMDGCCMARRPSFRVPPNPD